MNKLIIFLVPLIAFLLPWQTRFIFGAEDIGGWSQFGVWSIYAVESLVLLAVLLSPRRTLETRDRLPLMGLSAVVTVTLVSIALSIAPILSAFTAAHIVIGALYFVLLLDRRVNLSHVMMGFVAGLVVPSIFGIIQVFTGGFPASTVLGMSARDATELGESVWMMGGERWLRAYGSFSHPNVFGGYLAVGIVTAGYLAMEAVKKERKTAFIVAGILFVVTLFLTQSQSAWIGLFLAALVALIAYKVKPVDRARKLVIPVAFLIIGGVFSVMLFGGSLLPALERVSSEERIEQYQEYPAVIKDHWMLGVGAGAYSAALEEENEGKSWWSYQPIHNVPLLILAEIGVLGLLAVLFWTMPIDQRNFSRFPHKGAVAAFMMGNVILVILFFDHYLWSSWSGLALVAYVMALTQRLGEEG